MFKYEIVIYWSQEDKLFVAEVPELPGCIAHGNSQETALKNINDAMALWSATAKEDGCAVPPPCGRPLRLA